MKTQTTLITAALTLALAGNAQAGVRDWLKDKKDLLKAQTTEQTAAGPTDQERADCQAFLNTRAAQTDKTRREHCASVVIAPKTLGTVEVKGQAPSKPPVDKGKVMGTAGKGCGIGGLIGALAGVDPNIGCAAGGLIGAGWSYHKQVKQAREVEAAAKAAGMDATVATEQRVDEKGKKQEALAALTIRYEAADMEAMDQETSAMLDKLATLLSKSKNSLTVRFEGAKSCQIPLVELQKRGAFERHKSDNQCGKGTENRIVVSPLPDVR